jgi:hypothetical protein
MKTISWLITLLAAQMAFGTGYTASATGNWNSSSTWGSAGVPGNGDTASIGAFTVTVTVNTTVGASGANGTTAITMTSLSGKVSVATGVTLTLRGNFQVHAGNTCTGTPALLLQAGSTLEWDSSAASSPSTTKYAMLPDGTFFCNFFQANGTSGSRVTVTSNSGGGNGYFTNNGQFYGGTFIATYTDFSNIGDGTNTCGASFNTGCYFHVMSPLTSYVTTWDVEHSTFNDCGAISFLTAYAPDNIFIHLYNRHTNTQTIVGGITYTMAATFSQTVTTGARNLIGNVFDGVFGGDGSQNGVVPGALTITDNYFGVPPQFGGTYTWVSWTRNLWRTVTGTSVVAEGDMTYSYSVNDQYTNSLHDHNPDIGAAPTTFSFLYNVADSTWNVSDPSNSNDGVVEPVGPDQLTSEAIKYDLVIPTGDGFGSQSLADLVAGDSTTTFTNQYDIEHNTTACPYAVIGCLGGEYEHPPHGASDRGILSNNIFWAASTLTTNWAAVLGLENCLTDWFAPSSVAHNSHWNLDATESSSTCTNQGNSYVAQWSVTPGGSDINGNPLFVDTSRNLTRPICM